MADDDSPQNAEFIGRVVSDAKNPPDARMLTGWFGDAAEEGQRRLYTCADLSAYVDLPADAILHSEPVRDSQPPGAVFVWVRRDAVAQSGGSAASRAARFLQGQVTQDFGGGGGGGCVDLSSPEKAGYRCVTQVPCGEVTGFTGQCTKQPEVGGAWPCITAAPFCVEVTGFTGKCTPLPWPHPTRYVGCTILHCPTRDLTHIQQICNIVATGMPGCGVIDPGIGGDPVEKQAVQGNEGGGGAAAAGATMIPGCGYTQTWGLCETKLLGCGTTQVPKCQVSVQIPCIPKTEMPQHCGNVGGNLNFAAAAQAGPALSTEVLQCHPSWVDACPTRIGCETQQVTTFCTQPPFCDPTTVPDTCPRTWCGPECQTQQEGCTKINCVTQPQGDCTFFGCPTEVKGCTQAVVCPSIAAPCPTPDCTITPPICLGAQPAGAQAFAAAAPGAAGGGAQITLLTIPVWQCTPLPTPATHCFICPPRSPLPWHCQPSPFPGLCPAPSPWCPPITQTWTCGGGPSAVDACPTRICGGGGGLGGDPAAGRFAQPAQAQAFGNVGNLGGNIGRTDAAFGGGCPPFFTQFANQCVLGPVTFELQCPTNPPQCLPTSPPQCPFTVQGCPTSFPNCQLTHVACTVAGPQCPLNVGTVFGPQCPGRQVGPTGFQGCTQTGACLPTAACRENTFWPCTRFHCFVNPGAFWNNPG
ncbi:MAG: hypothetical protein ACJ75H_23895 [Thermoanaerobaculia bacterium]